MLFFFSFFSYLKLTGATRIPEIFRTEMDASLISAVVDVLDHHLKACPDAVDEVLAVVEEIRERVALHDQRRRRLPHVALEGAALKGVEPVHVPSGEVLGPPPGRVRRAVADPRPRGVLDLRVLLLMPRRDVLLEVRADALGLQEAPQDTPAAGLSRGVILRLG